ncbi:MAG TPA: hypothetical protein VFK69_09220 [Candidatus Eisenbacteria bacterium]|nr:hypothetical protein [Candidatus Eisenbacteria bacterium]
MSAGANGATNAGGNDAASAGVRRAARALALLAALAMAAPCAAQVPPAPAPPDTAFGRYLETLSDSTDRYFGIAAEPVDTVGLDTVLASHGATTHPFGFTVMPAFSFTRVDGPVPGVSASISGSDDPMHPGFGTLGGKLAYATGPNDWMGYGRYHERLFLGVHAFDVQLWAGRATAFMNRDRDSRYLDTWRAFVWGGDGAHYLRHDGFAAALEHDSGPWRATLGFRDVLESPRDVSASWNLLGRRLVVPFNLAAARGRTHELALDADARWHLVRGEAQGWLSNAGLGSDFDYRRVRVAAGAELPLGRTLALVPQAAYGRLRGDALPQQAFYLGGGPTLRSLPRDDRGGTTLALARVDAVLAKDLLSLAHVEDSGALPLRLGVFAAAGAVRGPDPYGGGDADGDWPRRAAWRSELGASLQYDTALLENGSFLRWSVAWAVGPGAGRPRVSVVLSRALDLLRAPAQ